MKKTILIPTDFTVQSLSVLKSILSANASNNTYDIILLHGFSLNDSIMDLLFFSKFQQINTLSSPEFKEACEVIKNKFASQINSIKTDLFSGYTVSSFNNYIEVNKVDEIIMTDATPSFSHKNSFSLLRFIKKCNINPITINTTIQTASPEKGKVAEVFSQISIG
jgi:hypothetical protein